MSQRGSSQTGTLWKCLLFLAMTSLARGMERDTLTPTFNAHQGATRDDPGADHMNLTTDTTRYHDPEQNYSKSLNAAKSVRFGGGEELAFYQDDPATLCKFDPNDPRLTSVATIPADRDVSRSIAMAKILKYTFRGEQFRRFAQHIIDLLEQNNTKEARAVALKLKLHKIVTEHDAFKALITTLDVDINLAEAYTLLMYLRDGLMDASEIRCIRDVNAALLELDVAFNKQTQLRVYESSLESSLSRKATDARDVAKVLEDPQLDACLDRLMKDIASMEVRKKNVDLITKATRLAHDLAAALELPFEKATQLREWWTSELIIFFQVYAHLDFF